MNMLKQLRPVLRSSRITVHVKVSVNVTPTTIFTVAVTVSVTESVTVTVTVTVAVTVAVSLTVVVVVARVKRCKIVGIQGCSTEINHEEIDNEVYEVTLNIINLTVTAE